MQVYFNRLDHYEWIEQSSVIPFHFWLRAAGIKGEKIATICYSHIFSM